MAASGQRNNVKVSVEPVTGIEPAPSAWEAEILPLNYTGGTPVGVKGSLAEPRPEAEIFPPSVPAGCGRPRLAQLSAQTPSSLPLGSAKWKRRPPGKSKGPSVTVPPAADTARRVVSRSSE